MSNWKEIQLNKQHIIYENARSYLFKAPNKSNYKKYTMWISKKLVKPGYTGHTVTLIYKDDFEFKLTKQNKRYEVMAEKVVSGDELAEIFANKYNDYSTGLLSSYCNVTEPDEIKIEKVDVLDEFKND